MSLNFTPTQGAMNDEAQAKTPTLAPSEYLSGPDDRWRLTVSGPDGQVLAYVRSYDGEYVERQAEEIRASLEPGMEVEVEEPRR